MKIKDQYINRYLKKIAIDQLYDQYTKNEYRVSKSGKTKEFSYDLLARKLSERIFVLVQITSFTENEKANLVRLTEYVKSINSKGINDFKFYVAFVNPINQKSIEFSELEILLSDHLSNYTPDEILELSTNSTVDHVSDVDINEIEIYENRFFANGNGIVSVSLEFGSNSDIRNDDGFTSSDSFPFSFEIDLEYDSDKQKFVINVDNSTVEVDTSSYFE